MSYSFGISTDVSWDLDMAERNYDVFMYDMTIDGLPQNHERFHFFKEGVAGQKIPEQALDTLENFVRRNGHANNRNMILKMDVEGAEWDFIQTVSFDLLSRFSQMVFEFHNLISPKNFTQMAITLELLRKMNATHTLIHLHGNNNSPYLQIEGLGCFPDTLELTYANNALYEFYDDDIELPHFLDKPNHPAIADIKLGHWNRF